MIRFCHAGPAILLALISIAWAPAHADEGQDVFVGYVSGRADGIDYSLYTHLCHAFVVADADGRLRPNPHVPDREFARRAHQNDVRVLLSLGGWGWDAQFAQMVLDPDAEDRYVRSVLALVDEADYDGIDVDWEYPDSREEMPGYERLTAKLRRGLDTLEATKGRPHVLTMAAAAHPRTLAWLTNDFLVASFDWVNVMTYDYAGSWTSFAGHHAPVRASSKAPGGDRQSIERTLDYLLVERKLPPRRIALGLPLYGRAYSVSAPYETTESTTRPGRAVVARDINGLLAEGWRREWDAETDTAWLFAPTADAVLGYDDAESIRLKTQLAKSRDLRGVFFWEVGQDRIPDGTNPLQQAAKAAWAAPISRGSFE